MYSSFCDDFPKIGNFGDTALQLDGYGYGACETNPFGKKQTKNSAWGNCMDAPDDGCKLVLGLGPTPSAYYSDNSSIQIDKDKATALGFFGATHQVCLDGSSAAPIVDEGSTSAKKLGGYMASLISTPRMEKTNISFANTSLISSPRAENTNISLANKPLELDAKYHCQISSLSSEPSTVSSYAMGAVSELTSVAVSSDHKGSNTKRCKFLGCTKGARGATGLCIGHGGGQRCQKVGCNKGAESRTVYCKAHGGGRRCQHLGCTKSAEGKTDLCIAHGGGRRCGHPGGCTKAARGKSGLCIRHGGGKRCKVEGCTRSAEGQIGLCISHGGGRRCHFLGCSKGAQGSTLFCKAHGGGKRCIFSGCTKGAEGSTPLCKGHGGGKRCMFDGGGICPKSVHGGTSYCVAHGGGKRCAVPGCTKSARGRTDCCVKHGGGKRCRFENCTKSAQGSTDLCKAHGGGKRCSWAEGKCEKFARGKSGLCAAHTRLAQGQETSVGGLIGPSLFHGLVPAASAANGTCSSYGASVISESTDLLEKPRKRQQLIPPQVLVPLSMKDSLFSICGGSNGTEKVVELVIPEGRVHGGGLLSLLGGNLNNASMDGI